MAEVIIKALSATEVQTSDPDKHRRDVQVTATNKR